MLWILLTMRCISNVIWLSVCFRSETARTWPSCHCGPTNWSFFLMRSDRWPNCESLTSATTGTPTRTHTHTHTETKLLYDSVVNRYNAHTSANFFNGRFGSVYCFHGNGWVCCYGYMLCGLYSAWVMKHLWVFFSFSPSLSPPLSVCLSRLG